MDSRESKPSYDLEKIDFEWVASTNNVKELKKALKALQDDKGGYFELEKALETKILELDPSSKKPSNSISAAEMQNIEKDLENWSESIENKEKLLKEQETQGLVLNESLSQKAKEAGNDYLRAKDYDQALDSYSKAIDLNPRNAPAYFNRALVLLKQFKYKKAAEDCDKAILINPKYFKAFHRRALALMELKEWEKAVEDWKVVLENDPENEEANEKLKKCRDELSSITGYRRIQITEVEDEEEEEEVPANADPLSSDVQSPPDQPGDPEDLQDIEKDPALQSIIALQSQEEFIKELDRLKSEGNSAFRKEDYDQSITVFTKSIFAIEKRFDEEKILTSPPVLTLTVAFYNNRALAYSKLDLNLEAINDSRKVLKLDKNNSKALFRIGKCQLIRNNLQAAQESFEHLLSIEPNNELAKKELEEIKAKSLRVKSETLVVSPRNRSSFRKADSEVDRSYERRVSFREEDVSIIEHKDSLKTKEKFKKAEAAFPKKLKSDDESEGSDKEEKKVKKEVISKETIQNAKEIASKLVVLDAPKTALMFESAAKSLNSDPASFYEYIHKIKADELLNLFERTEFSVELLGQCLEVCSFDNVDFGWAIEFFTAVSATCRFSTTVKLLSKKEKAKLLEFFNRIGASELPSVYKLIN